MVIVSYRLAILILDAVLSENGFVYSSGRMVSGNDSEIGTTGCDGV